MKIIYLFITFLIIFYVGCGSNRSTVVKVSKKPDINISRKLVIPKDGEIYFGAYADFGHSEHNVTQKKIKDFENLALKKLAWVCISNNWSDGIIYPKAEIDIIQKSACTPLVRMMPRSDNNQLNQKEDSNFTMQKIIDGKFDKALTKWAEDAKKDDIPLLLDFAPEMTGFWFQWSGKYSGAGILDGYGDRSYPDGPERYRDAYRHIIDIFRKVGVKHVTWFFHPDIQRLPNVEWNSAKYYYPGDDYIDWIGLSIYGVQRVDDPWIYFSQALKKQYMLVDEITDKKPIAVLEFAVTDYHASGSKSAWLEDTFASVLHNPYFDFKAINYWHEDWINPGGKKTTLRIDSSTESLETFKKLVSDKHFISKTRFH